MWFANKPLSNLEYNYIGEVYEFIIQKPIMRVAYYFMKIDTVVVDGAINGVGKLAMVCSQKMQKVQSGQIQHYAMIMLAGVIILIIIGVVLP
jgi:NADH:ubiquinone oxidoreductase subunit 5 (subunit L)/multisubunit Na+/H+ antiporter MnhA subunit